MITNKLWSRELTALHSFGNGHQNYFKNPRGQGKRMAESIFEKVRLSICQLSICRKLVRLSIIRPPDQGLNQTDAKSKQAIKMKFFMTLIFWNSHLKKRKNCLSSEKMFNWYMHFCGFFLSLLVGPFSWIRICIFIADYCVPPHWHTLSSRSPRTRIYCTIVPAAIFISSPGYLQIRTKFTVPAVRINKNDKALHKSYRFELAIKYMRDECYIFRKDHTVKELTNNIKIGA